MSAAPARSFHPVDSVSCPQADMGAVTKSRVKVLDQSSVAALGRASAFAASDAHARARELAARRALDLPDAEGVLPLAAAEFRDWFVPVFARWLQANFETIEHVARAFRVRHSTAANWWNGRNCLSGDVAGIVFLTFPAAVSWFLAEWKGR